MTAPSSPLSSRLGAALVDGAPPPLSHAAAAPGCARLVFRRAGAATVLERAFAASPARLLAPRNHGHAAWVFLATFGGGLLDRDRLDVELDVGPGASALLGTQASTKVYRSPNGCAQRLRARVASGAELAIVPDPVVCFAGARYAQDVEVTLGAGASLVLLDGYTCGRSARGERWEFDRYASRTTVTREGARLAVDATRLDASCGPLAARMGEFDAVLSLYAVGPAFASVRDTMLASSGRAFGPDSSLIAAASRVADDAVLLRVASRRFESASKTLRPSFAALAGALGDDPFARKW